jgi:hypothetical protein
MWNLIDVYSKMEKFANLLSCENFTVYKTRPPFYIVVHFVYILMDFDPTLEAYHTHKYGSDEYEICRG